MGSWNRSLQSFLVKTPRSRGVFLLRSSLVCVIKRVILACGVCIIMATLSLDELKRDLEVIKAVEEGKIQVIYGEEEPEDPHLTEEEVRDMFDHLRGV